MRQCAWCGLFDDEWFVTAERPGTWLTAATWAFHEEQEPPPLMMHPTCAALYDEESS